MRISDWFPFTANEKRGNGGSPLSLIYQVKYSPREKNSNLGFASYMDEY
jgi:hypothetical protein